MSVKPHILYSMKSRISAKGQVTVPIAVRDRLGLLPGTAVEFIVREREAVMRKGRAEEPVDRVYGRLELERRVDELVDEMRGPRPRPVRGRGRRKKR